MTQRFRTYERLKHRKAIEAVFETGSHLSAYPLRLVWVPRVEQRSDSTPVRMAFSVPKRLHKHAADRNRIKRRMREAWRLSKSVVYQQLDTKTYDAMLIYSGKEISDYNEILLSLTKICQKWMLKIQPS
jgi:ribonuclease P protein component